MGAWGGASTGIRMTSPRLAALWMSYPVWRHDRRSCGHWAGDVWTSAMPFKATVAAATPTLGCTAASVLMSDGSTWGGAGGYADIPGYIAANPNIGIPPDLLDDRQVRSLSGVVPRAARGGGGVREHPYRPRLRLGRHGA